MDKCTSQIFNKKTEKAFEKEYNEKIKKMNAFIKAYPNSPLSKRFKKTVKNTTLQKEKKKRIEEYRKTMCNPTCKGTVFESGDPNKLPPSYVETLKKEKKKKDFINYQLSIRKELFGEKNTVLNDGFYKELDKNTVKKLRKKGAISGCYRGGLTAYNLIHPL